MMSIFAQIVLQIDTSDYLAPLLTVLFGFSFAIAPIFSNLFLSLSFVLFLVPFDIGDRVIIGKGTSTMLTGNITSIALFYTTITSNQNEVVMLPNHGLFYERIVNLSQSKNITFIIHVTFCMHGAEACPQVRIVC
jgi:small-conductance mechanosensitive channel